MFKEVAGTESRGKLHRHSWHWKSRETVQWCRGEMAKADVLSLQYRKSGERQAAQRVFWYSQPRTFWRSQDLCWASSCHNWEVKNADSTSWTWETHRLKESPRVPLKRAKGKMRGHPKGQRQSAIKSRNGDRGITADQGGRAPEDIGAGEGDVDGNQTTQRNCLKAEGRQLMC